MNARGPTTDRLADIIEVLQLAGKTGFLVATRYETNSFSEQGTIVFQNGQIVQANLGLLRSDDALTRLMAWKGCSYFFQASAPDIPMSNGITQKPDHQNNASQPHIPVKGLPYRTREANEVLPLFPSLGFSRVHRRIFLLVDGRRGEYELMHLTGHRLDEVQIILSDLERAGFIQR